MIDFAWSFKRGMAMDEIVKNLRSAYDAVPYKSQSYQQSHPDRLAVVAALAGIGAPDVESCRVLEIGCASGGNLIPMAEQLPRGRFLGVDLSGHQIKIGLNLVRELELTNLELRCQDLMEFPANEGQFDYIIAHGVYSWVPGAVQQRLLKICREHLAPRGVAYISYNAYPGWHCAEITRELMLFHARNAANQTERAARGREIVRFAAEHTLDKGIYRALLKSLGSSIGSGSDDFLLHDHMEEVNEPKYFRQFIDEIKGQGLAYVGDTGWDSYPWIRVPGPVREMIWKMSDDPLDREQYLDFLSKRTFRGSAICRAEDAVTATAPPADRLHGIYVAGNPPSVPAGIDAQGRPAFKFPREGNYEVVISDPRIIAMLRHLCGAWPSTVPISELRRAFDSQSASAQDLKDKGLELDRVIDAHYELGLIELWTRPMGAIAHTPGRFPRATRYARRQASDNLMATSLRHAQVKLDDAMRQLIPLLDGTRDCNALAEELFRTNEAAVKPLWPSKSRGEFQQLVESSLKRLAASSLLIDVTALP
jgi:SAM-dependent methyltransferase